MKSGGGLCIIDEAYALKDSPMLEFLMTKMENDSPERKAHIIFLFMGYPDKMSEMLQKNPGLTRRFKWNFLIDNATPEDLVELTIKIAKDKQQTLLSGVRSLLKTTIFAETNKTNTDHSIPMHNFSSASLLVEQAMFSRNRFIDLPNASAQSLRALGPDDFIFAAQELRLLDP